jgi:hypothetical protein
MPVARAPRSHGMRSCSSVVQSTGSSSLNFMAPSRSPSAWPVEPIVRSHIGAGHQSFGPGGEDDAGVQLPDRTSEEFVELLRCGLAPIGTPGASTSGVVSCLQFSVDEDVVSGIGEPRGVIVFWI